MQHFITVRFAVGEAETDTDQHNNRVWLRDQLSSRFDYDDVEFIGEEVLPDGTRST